MTPLAEKLKRRIEAVGPLSFHDYMDACLYDPDYGYYIKASPLGRDGDFITAPEISQIFGEIIGVWISYAWQQMGSPPRLQLVECGPGRGTLITDALRVLQKRPDLINGLDVHLVERSKPLRQTQATTLHHAFSKLTWHDTLETVPRDRPTIVVANEFLDCFPVRVFRYHTSDRNWHERMVERNSNGFILSDGQVVCLPSDTQIDNTPVDGNILEYSPHYAGFLCAVKGMSNHHPLAALIVDYGHERSGFGETVQAVKDHRFINIFERPGESDLTAHVDFSYLKALSEQQGFSSFGPMPMGQWLLQLGAQIRLDRLCGHATAEQTSALQNGLARLIDPTQMGDLFKIMALTANYQTMPPPFS